METTQAGATMKDTKTLLKKYSKPAYLKQLNAEEKLQNQKIIQNMSKRINYLKNPKYASNQKPPDTNIIPTGTLDDGQNPFRVEPSMIKFSDYQASGLYEIPLKITNNTHVLQRLKWVPPQTPHFSISNVKWPSSETHQVAAGMSVVLKINFLAPSFADYDDQVVLITQNQSYKIPLQARRDPPVISLSNPMECGACWLGDRSTITFRCQNKGGEGMFRFFTQEQHLQRAAYAAALEKREAIAEQKAQEFRNSGMDDVEMEEEIRRGMEEQGLQEEEALIAATAAQQDEDPHGDILRAEPFTIYPAEFYLHSGSVIDIMVAFLPQEEGTIEQKVVLACDNQTSQVFTIKGTGSMLTMRLYKLDGKELEEEIQDEVPQTAEHPTSVSNQNVRSKDQSFEAAGSTQSLQQSSQKQALSDLFFPNTNPTATSTRSLVIKNTSSQNINFHWSIYREKNVKFKKLSLDDQPTHFEVEPTQGKFTPGEEKQFVFSFSPLHAEPYYEFADLVIQDIPLSSLHDPPPGLRAIHSSSVSLMGPPGPTHVASNTRFPSVPLYQFSLCGQGNLCSIEVAPPVLLFPGDTYYNKKIKQEFKIVKRSQGVVNFTVKIAKQTSKALKVSLLERGTYVLGNGAGYEYKGHFSAEQDELDLDMELESQATKGKMGVFLYVTVEDGGPETFQAWANFIGPSVTIVEPEVNFGLMKINDKQRFRLHIKNNAPVDCEVALKRIEETELTFNTIKMNFIGGTPEAYQSQEDIKATEEELVEGSAKRSKTTVSFQEFEVVYHPNNSVSAITDLTALDEQELEEILAREVPNQVLYDPPFMKLGPEEEKSVLLTLQTNSPETINSLVEVIVGGGTTSHIAIKAEIQKPQVILSRYDLKLGTQFAGMPVRVDPYAENSVVMRNQGNIPVQFHWQELSDPNFADIVFEPAKGLIPPHSELEISFGVTFYTGGQITKLLMCEVDDLELPLAIQMTATVMGLSVVYEKVDEKSGGAAKLRKTGIKDASSVTMSHTQMLRTLRSSRGLETKSRFTRSRLQETAEDLNREAVKLRRIDFIQCEINKPATQRFVIRNESGIPTSFKLWPQFYAPAPLKSELANQKEMAGAVSQQFSEERASTKGSLVSSRAAGQKKILRFAPSAKGTTGKKGFAEGPKRLNRAILSDAHQQTQKFQSNSGETFTQTKRLQGEQQHYLANNKGLAIVCQPNSGDLPPHGQMLIKVTAFNNVCGRFQDMLTSEVQGLPTMHFPIKVLVTGTPVQIPGNQVGLNYSDIPPSLAFPCSVVDNPPSSHTFRVQNKGIQDLRLDWKIFDLKKPGEDLLDTDRTTQEFFDIDIVPNEEASPEMEKLEPFKLDFKAIEPPPAKDSAFSIIPMHAIIESKGNAIFTVKFDSRRGLGFFQSTVLAHPQLVDDYSSSVGSRKPSIEEQKQEASAKTFLDLEQGSVSTTHSAMLKDLGFVALYTTGSTIHPKLSVDKHVTSEGQQVVKFKAWSVQHDTAPRLVKKITLTNNTLAELKFNLTLNGPFELVKTKTNAAQKLAKEKLPPRPHSGLGKLGKLPPPQTMFLLQPSTIVETHIGIKTPKVSALDEWPMIEQAVKEGQLRVTFSNQEKQVIRLKGVLMRPKLIVQAELAKRNEKAELELDFGTTHIEKPKRQTLYLSNLTEVLANWSLHYIKFQKKETLGHRTVTALERENIEKTDDPEVFEFVTSGGYLQGPSVPLKLTPDGLVLKNPLAGNPRFDKNNVPAKVLVNFRPKENVLYKSKFRFMVEDGIPCDITLKGRGSYEEENDKD